MKKGRAPSLSPGFVPAGTIGSASRTVGHIAGLRSEVDLRTELDDSRGSLVVRKCLERTCERVCSRRVPRVEAGPHRPVRMVEGIQERCLDFERHPLIDGEDLVDRNIRVEETGAVEE